MLGPVIESLIATFLNVKEINEGVAGLIAGLEETFKKKLDMSIKGVSHIGMDTRPTSEVIFGLVK